MKCSIVNDNIRLVYLKGKANIMKIIAVGLSFILVMFNGIPALAETIEKDGYKLTFQTSTRNNMLTLSGRISGPPCGLLRVDIFLYNENGAKAHIWTSVRNVSVGGSRVVSGKDRVFDRGGRSWSVRSVYFNCNL